MRPVIPAVVSALLCALAAVPSGAAEPVRSLLEMRRERTVMQAWDLSCGAAALATLLNYQHGDMISGREIAVGMMQQERYVANPLLVRLRNGFSLLDIKRFADARGYEGVGYGGLDLDDLVERAPIMVPITRTGYNHFVGFRGRMGNRVLLADPAFGTMTMPVERFERDWLELEELGRVGFVVLAANGAAAPNRLAPRPEEFATLR